MRQQGISVELPWHVRCSDVGQDSLRQLSSLAADPDVALPMASIEVGTDNVNDYNPETKQFIDYDVVERMAHFEIRHVFDLCRDRNLRPYLGIKEPGELRHIGSYLDLGWLEPPAILKFTFSDFAPYGLPPAAECLDMYVEMIDMVMPGVPVEWFVACNGPSIWQLAPAAIKAGGHVQIGLGQYHPTHWRDRTNEQPTNAELVARLAELGRADGRETATPAEASALLGLRQLERL
jgi:3-keto-5-aminohexanoate cleavage enzyme